MPLYWTYVIYTSALAVALILLVPREAIRRLAWPAIIAGAIADAFAIVFLDLLGLAHYIHQGPFGFMGVPFFPLLAWTIWFIMFLYFMPERLLSAYVYTAIACAYALMFGNMLVNLGILNFAHRIIVPLAAYIPWFFTTTWLYTRWRNRH